MAKKYVDPNGRHARIYCTLLDSPAWRCLSWSSRALFLDLRATLGKTNNGDISATLGDLKHRGWRSPTTLAGALYGLQALGFLVKTRCGGVEAGSKVCSLYAFTDLDNREFVAVDKAIPAAKASHAYLKYTSVAAARAALTAGVEDMRAQARARKQLAKKKTTRQKLDRDTTVSGSVRPLCATDSGAEGFATRQKLEQGKRVQTARKAA